MKYKIICSTQAYFDACRIKALLESLGREVTLTQDLDIHHAFIQIQED